MTCSTPVDLVYSKPECQNSVDSHRPSVLTKYQHFSKNKGPSTKKDEFFAYFCFDRPFIKHLSVVNRDANFSEPYRLFWPHSQVPLFLSGKHKLLRNKSHMNFKI